ncbi:transposase [bacterium]|nr:transposase [bacterium]
MREIAYSRICYGYWRIKIMLKREGFTDNHKRVQRLVLRTRTELTDQSASQKTKCTA